MEEPKEFRRISIDEARLAYCKTALKPRSGLSHFRKFASPIVACAIYEGMLFDKEQSIAYCEASEFLNLSDQYRDGFISGFDGHEPERWMIADAKTESGYTDGRAVREALLAKETK